MNITSINNNVKALNSDKYVKSLKNGDVLSGKVIDIREGKLTLKISAEQTISAALLTNEQIEEGSIIDIVITNINDEKIYAKILKENLAEETPKDEILKMLKELGVSAKELDIYVFKALINHRLSISKDTIDYIKFLHKVVEPFKGNTIREAMNLIFSGRDVLNSAIDEFANISPYIDSNGIIDTHSLETEYKTGQNNKNIVESFAKTISKNFVLEEEPPVKLEHFFNEAIKAAGALKKTDLDSLIFLLSRNIKITPMNLHILNNINAKENILSENIYELLNQLKGLDDSKIKFISTKLSESILQPYEITKDLINVRSRVLLSTLAELEPVLESKGIESYEIRENLMNLRNTIDMIKSINNNINYIHLPIIINNEETDVEIFVYERGKRNKKVDFSNFNILICLNLKNIGYIESHINIKDRKANIVFKSENQDTVKIINQHSQKLKDALSDKGYTIIISSIEKENGKFNLSSMEEVLNNKEISRYSIDVRI